MNGRFLGVAVTLVLVAGCAEPGDLKQDATLDYEGAQSGDHEKKADCDGDATFRGSGEVEDGRLQVTVRDAEGKQLFSRTFDGEFRQDPVALTGADGAWEVRAVRSGDDVVGDEFKGHYSLALNC